MPWPKRDTRHVSFFFFFYSVGELIQIAWKRILHSSALLAWPISGAENWEGLGVLTDSPSKNGRIADIASEIFRPDENCVVASKVDLSTSLPKQGEKNMKPITKIVRKSCLSKVKWN